jgi:hypothetical protein
MIYMPRSRAMRTSMSCCSPSPAINIRRGRLRVARAPENQVHPLQWRQAGRREEIVAVAVASVIAPRRWRMQDFPVHVIPSRQAVAHRLETNSASRAGEADNCRPHERRPPGALLIRPCGDNPAENHPTIVLAHRVNG